MSYAEPPIVIDDLHFAYEDTPVLQGITLAIPAGKLSTILGVSGCGKSTLLKLIGGQLKPQRGEVRLFGQSVHHLEVDALYALRRRIGMMFQAGGLFSDLTVFDNVAFPLRELTDLSEALIRDLVHLKLEAVGLRGAAALMPAELSGGMSRRVALARAIALDPPLLIYDEPFAGLDPISLGVVARLIRRLGDALGATSIVVTYDVSESLALADHAFFLHQGRIVAEGEAGAMVQKIRGSGLARDWGGRTGDNRRDPGAAATSLADGFVRQFVQALPDGPVAFHHAAVDYAFDLRLPPRQSQPDEHGVGARTRCV